MHQDKPTYAELEQYATNLSQEVDIERSRRAVGERLGNESTVRGQKDISTISFLFDTKGDIERAEHLLRGDTMLKGQWTAAPNSKNRVMTDLGVQEIINHALLPHLSMTVVLGNLSEEQFIIKMRTFYRFLVWFIINRSEDFFYYEKAIDIYNRYKSNPLASEYSDEELIEDARRVSLAELQSKMNHLPMIIQQITNLVAARYSASINGAALREIMRHTTVSEVTSTSGVMGGSQKGGFNLFKPSTWR